MFIRGYEAAINRRRFLDGPIFIDSHEVHDLSDLDCWFFTPLRIQIWSETVFSRGGDHWRLRVQSYKSSLVMLYDAC
jgi:hypothetical protein